MNKEEYRKWYEDREKKEAYAEWYEKGQNKMDKGNFSKAIKLFTRVIELNPNFSLVYLDRGFCYQGIRKYRKANLDFEKYLELDPEAEEKAQLLFFMGMNYVLIDPTDDLLVSKAIDYLTVVIDGNPKIQKAYTYRATARGYTIQNWFSKRPDKGARLKFTLFEEMISDYLKALELDPDDVSASISLGNLLNNNIEMSEPEDVIVCCSNLIDRFPSNALIYFLRGYAYERKEQHDLALAELDKAIALDPEYAEAYSYRGAIYGVLGQYDLSLKDVSKAVILKPYIPFFTANLSTTYFLMGDIDRAIHELKRAISLCRGQQYAAYRKRYSIRLKDYQKLNEDGLTELQKAEAIKEMISDSKKIHTVCTKYITLSDDEVCFVKYAEK